MLPALVHIRHSYATCGQSSYVATFHANPIELDRFYRSREKGTPDYILSTLADQSMGPTPSFSLITAIEVVG
jgi:hypothetical protein